MNPECDAYVPDFINILTEPEFDGVLTFDLPSGPVDAVITNGVGHILGQKGDIYESVDVSVKDGFATVNNSPLFIQKTTIVELTVLPTNHVSGVIFADEPTLASFFNFDVADIEYFEQKAFECYFRLNAGTFYQINQSAFLGRLELTAFRDNQELCIGIGANAFRFCENLSEIHFPRVSAIGDRAFDACENLEKAEFPYPVSNFGKNVFEFCSALLYVNINTKRFGDYAFFHCEKLHTIVCAGYEGFSGGGITGRGTFQDTPALKNLNINYGAIKFLNTSTFQQCGLEIHEEFPICTEATFNCFEESEISALDLPIATKLGNDVCKNATNLKTIFIPNVTTIGTNAFLGVQDNGTINLTMRWSKMRIFNT